MPDPVPDPLPHTWGRFPIADGVDVGVWAEVPLSLDALSRLITILTSMQTQMKKGPVQR